MEIKPKIIKRIIKLSVIGGFFALLAYSCTSMAYYFSIGNIEVLQRFEAAGNLNIWLKNNFSSIYSALNRVIFIFCILLLSFLAYVSSAFASTFFDMTKQSIKEGLVKK